MKQMFVVLLLCTAQITVSMHPVWRGAWLKKYDMPDHIKIETLELNSLPNDRNEISKFEQELKQDMRDYLQWVAEQNRIILQDKDITVTLRANDFDKNRRTITCFVTGEYRCSMNDSYDTTFKDTLSITVGIHKCSPSKSTCSIS